MRGMSPAKPTPPTDTRWRWRRLVDAPHRIAFFGGACLFAVAGVWWAAALIARTHAVGWPWAVPSGVAHVLVLGYGALPLYFAGFLATTLPKWLAHPALPAALLRAPVVAALAGWALALAGVHGSRLAAAAGVALVAAAHAAVLQVLARLLRDGVATDRLHARCAVAGYAATVAALVVVAVALAAGADGAARAALAVGLWGGVGIVFAAALHRLVPFFGAAALPLLDERWPAWLLWTLVGTLAFEAAATLADAAGVSLPPAARGAFEALVATVLLALAVRWAVVQNLRLRLIAMLHLGFVWLGVAIALSAASQWLEAAGQRGLAPAPLHALAAGCYGSVLLAMGTRVSAGLSGRTIAADDVTWRLFGVLQLAVLARIAAELWPGAARWLLPLAALAWAAATATWAARLALWYGRPRVDGRPG